MSCSYSCGICLCKPIHIQHRTSLVRTTQCLIRQSGTQSASPGHGERAGQELGTLVVPTPGSNSNNHRLFCSKSVCLLLQAVNVLKKSFQVINNRLLRKSFVSERQIRCNQQISLRKRPPWGSRSETCSVRVRGRQTSTHSEPWRSLQEQHKESQAKHLQFLANISQVRTQ